MATELFVLLAAGAYVGLLLSFVARAILRPHREASSRAAWILVILSMPFVGMMAYTLFGGTNIGQKRLSKYLDVTQKVRRRVARRLIDGQFERVAEKNVHLFRLGQSVNGLGPIGGSRGELMPDTNSGFDRLIADIDAACESVHVLFYIWLDDTNGLRVAEAAARAARRGVTVRVMADDIGARRFIRSRHWRDMEAAGVRVAAALPIKHLFLHPVRGRVDLRNHRKIVVIDNAIGYCGSPNCADPEFRIKARFAPWVDLFVRLDGPVAVQLQYLFVQDWMAHTDDDLTELVSVVDAPTDRGGIVTQAIGTGPTIRPSAMPDVFEVLIHAARRELLITTPYYVPSDAMHDAFCLTARRGVRAVLMVPQTNDSWVVAAASRSYYGELLAAGVEIYEFPDGLLHAKILTVDAQVALIGSANLDRRSFELNYESNVLLQDAAFTAKLVERQESYRAASKLIGKADVAGWSMRRHFWNNAVAMMGPIL